jgi:hypothetical protein
MRLQSTAGARAEVEAVGIALVHYRGPATAGAVQCKLMSAAMARRTEGAQAEVEVVGIEPTRLDHGCSGVFREKFT